MKSKKGLVICIVVLLIVSNAVALCAGMYVQASRADDMKFTYNDEPQEFFDPLTGEKQVPLLYNDRTYLPVRSIAEFLDLNVSWDSTTGTVSINNYSQLSYKDIARIHSILEMHFIGSRMNYDYSDDYVITISKIVQDDSMYIVDYSYYDWTGDVSRPIKIGTITIERYAEFGFRIVSDVEDEKAMEEALAEYESRL